MVEKYILLDARDPLPELSYKIEKQVGHLAPYKVGHRKVSTRYRKYCTSPGVVFL